MLKVLQLGSLIQRSPPKSMPPKIQLKAHCNAMTNFLLYNKYVLEHARCLRARLNYDFVTLSYQTDALFNQFQTFSSRNGIKAADGENKTWNHASIGMSRST